MTAVEPRVIVPSAAALALVDLADCVCNELAASGAGPVCWCGLWPGAEVSWEYCGDCGSEVCGMAWTRLVGVFPYESFPIPVIDAKCQLPLAWAIEVGAMRCLPQPPDGQVLGPVAMTEVAIAQVLDAGALWRAMKCCEAVEVATEIYTPLGPQGGCVGGAWLSYVLVD